MAETNNVAQAKVAFDTLCQVLDHHEWHYEKDEKDFLIECGAQGEDLPMKLTIKVDPDIMLILLLSHLPFVIQEDKRLEMAIAVSAINNILVDGCFDYDVTSGHMFFRMTNSFLESAVSEEVFSYLLYGSCQIIDEYNDKILMLAKGMLSLERFLELVAN